MRGIPRDIARAFPGQLGSLKAEGIALPMSDVMALIGSQEQVRGVSVFSGYLDNPDATAARAAGWND